MKKVLSAGAVFILMTGSTFANETERLAKAADAVRGIRTEISQEYWQRARCVVVIPELKKAAFIIGGEYGKGAMSCRAGNQWSAPVFMQLAKGSWGFQAGVEQADVVLLVMNESGAQKLLKNKVNLGADASISAGPLGRRGGVATDAAINAEIVSYSRSKGLFAGIDLSGGVLRPDDDANAVTYGAKATPSTILATREMSAPPEAAAFLAALRDASSGPADPPAAAASRPMASVTDDEVRARVIDIQQTVDRLLADTTPAPAGSSGSVGADTSASNTIGVDRARLLQLRQQLDGLLATLNRR